MSNLDSLERKFLYAISDRPNLVFELSEERFFSDKQLYRVYLKLKEYWTETRKLPTEEVMPTLFNSHEDLHLALRIILERSSSVLTSEEVKWIASKLEDKFINRTVRKYTMEAFETYFNKDMGIEGLEFLYDNISSLTMNIKANETLKQEDTSIIDSLSGRFKQLNESLNEDNIVSSGYAGWDEAYGGLIKTHLITMCSPQSKGKSTMLLNFSTNAFLDGYNVAFITIEVSRRDFERKFDSLITGIPVTKFFMNRLNEKDLERYKISYLMKIFPLSSNGELPKFLKENLNEIKITDSFEKLIELVIANGFEIRSNKFKIFDMPKGCTISSIEKLLMRDANMEGIDLLVIDYPGIMEIPDKSTNSWFNISELYKSLKQLTKFFNVATVVAAQLHDVLIDQNTILSSQMLRYSQSIVDHSDIVQVWNYNLGNEGLILTRGLKSRHSKVADIAFSADYVRMKMAEIEI